MTIIAARRYYSGSDKPHDIAVDGSARGAMPSGSFDWVGMADPSADEMELLRRQYGLHPLAIEDALTPNQMPKVEPYGSMLFIVARTAAINSGEVIDYGQTAMFLGRDFVISVRFGSTRAHHALRQRLESEAERFEEGPDFVAHAILDFVVDGYAPIMERLDEAVQGMEEAAIDAFPSEATIRRIFRLRRQLRRFDRVVGPMEEMCLRLAATQLPFVDASAQVWFRDVLDHVRRAMARAHSLNETLASIVDTASLLEQNRQGKMTRQLAAWAAILAVPTAIAGIYGMNFDFMPELRWRHGYYAVLSAIFLVCAMLWLRFRRIGWL